MNVSLFSAAPYSDPVVAPYSVYADWNHNLKSQENYIIIIIIYYYKIQPKN